MKRVKKLVLEMAKRTYKAHILQHIAEKRCLTFVLEQSCASIESSSHISKELRAAGERNINSSSCSLGRRMKPSPTDGCRHQTCDLYITDECHSGVGAGLHQNQTPDTSTWCGNEGNFHA